MRLRRRVKGGKIERMKANAENGALEVFPVGDSVEKP